MHKLPFDLNLEDVDILKVLSNTNNKIGELNGFVKSLPNPNIILNAVILGEAKESSEIENIVTTFDRIFKEITLNIDDSSSKEDDVNKQDDSSKSQSNESGNAPINNDSEQQDSTIKSSTLIPLEPFKDEKGTDENPENQEDESTDENLE